MNETIHILYFYVFPPITIILLLMLIVNRGSREEYFEEIKKDFSDAIHENQELSKEIIKNNFEETQNSANEILQNFNLYFYEKIERPLEKITQLEKKLETINNQQMQLNNNLKQLQERNIELEKELEKKEAIINRRTNKIKRMKQNELI